jgi:aminobenzoyl-glutamate transport protein
MSERAPHKPPRRGFVTRALDAIEAVGNRLPDTATLFVIIAVLILIASWVTARLGVSVIHPRDGSVIQAVDLLTRDGIRRIFTDAVRNFMNFAPLGIVLVAMIGIGVAERTGLITVSLRAMVMSIPRTLLTIAIIFAAMMSHLAGDAGIVLMPPIGAMLFAAAGRHPLAGMAAAFAGVSGGFSANILPSSLDVLLIGFTQEAIDASKLLPGYQAQVLGNYFFLFAATPILTLAGTWITERIVEPRLGAWTGGGEKLAALTPEEKRGLKAALLALIGVAALLVLLIGPSWAPLKGPGATLLERLKPAFDSMIVLIMLLFFVPGLAYGLASGTIRSDRDVSRMTGETLGTMGTYIALAFAAAQFVNYFAWSNLGAIIAIGGAGLLKSVGFEGPPLLASFILFAASVNLLITSASAKWAIIAPVFVPMFILLGFTPEGTQAVFRVGDSCTNIITPMLPYMPFIIATAQRYKPDAGSGTIVTLMIPYSVVFIVLWSALLMTFYASGWPIGPGVHLTLPR